MKRNSLSIVLPVRNAADRLPALVAEYLALAAAHAADYELILVLDGADSATEGQALALAATHAPVALLRSPLRRSFRLALASAWRVARGDLILAVDHQQVTAAEAARLLALADGQALLLGYRHAAPADPRPALAAIFDPARAADGPRDPGLQLALISAETGELIDPQGPEQPLGRELFRAARSRNLPLLQVAVAGRPGAGPEQRRGAALGVGMLLVAGALWVLRRWLPGARQ